MGGGVENDIGQNRVPVLRQGELTGGEIQVLLLQYGHRGRIHLICRRERRSVKTLLYKMHGSPIRIHGRGRMMAEESRCPLCGKKGEVHPSEAMTICELCGMSIDEKSPRLVLVGKSSFHTFCSQGCLKKYAAVGNGLLRPGRMKR